MMAKVQLTETLQIAIAHALSNLHTATIAKVTAVNATTIDCQPVTARLVDGQAIPLPKFVDVPPVFMSGGSSYTAHPIAVEDYALLVFTERCFDRWYEGQDNQPPLEFRMHDYSDGIAIVGLLPRASAITIPSLITQVGNTHQEGNYDHTGDMDRTGDVTHTGDTDQTGAFILTGAMKAQSFKTGTETGVSGTFLSDDAKTITVTNGLITRIV